MASLRMQPLRMIRRALLPLTALLVASVPLCIRAAEAHRQPVDATEASTVTDEEHDGLRVEEASFLQPDQPLPAARPLEPASRTGFQPRRFAGPAGVGQNTLSWPRAERVAGPGGNVIPGSESELRLTTDTGSMLGKSPAAVGLGVQRRTPIINDPRIRGMSTGQQLASGSYWFPARQDLDTALSKIDSRLIQDVIVIRGPYSALYGPGFSFYDVGLTASPRFECGREVHGSTTVDYQTNGRQLHGLQSLWGGSSDWGFRASYDLRTGNDYQSGNGTLMPSSYNSGNAYLAVGFDLSPDSHLEFNYLRLDQNNVEFPAQIFDLDYLVTDAFEVRYLRENAEFCDRMAVDGWWNATRFRGNSQRSSKRRQIPQLDDPLKLDGFLGFTDANASSSGFRLAATWGQLSDAQLTFGVDLRHLTQQLNEFNLSPALGTSLADQNFNFPIPPSHSTNPGLFVQSVLPVRERLTVKAGARLDLVSADAAKVVPNTDLDGNGAVDNLEESLGGAFGREFTLGSVFVSTELQLASHWTAVGGFGYAMRPPTLTELYAGLPSLAILQQGFTKVAGNPNLPAEKLWQVDLGLRGEYDRFRGGLHGFHAWVNDYITYEYVGDVAGFPDVIAVQFTNTDLATLVGAEAYGEYDVTGRIAAFGLLNYVEGRDQTRGTRGGNYGFSPKEPLPGIAPLESRVGIRLHAAEETPAWAIEVAARLVADQNRVASSLFEKPTPGFTTLDIRGYWQATDSLLLLAGVENVADVQYREHLDLRTGLGVYQPGRNFYFGTELRY